MPTVILGSGILGRAIAAGLVARGEPPPIVLGRPPTGRHLAADVAGADLAFEASRADAVVGNIEVALSAGCRRLVVATTGWLDERASVDDLLRSYAASAVVAPSFSLGIALFLRMVEVATGLFGRLDGYDPYVVEWHRREKLDQDLEPFTGASGGEFANEDRRTQRERDRHQHREACDAGRARGLHTGFAAQASLPRRRL